MNKLLSLIKREIVLTVSIILALISIILVPVDQVYISYIDFRTLAILFCLMVIMAGLQRLHVFRQIGERLILHVHTMHGISLVLILLCFFFSMFITNDVALLTFVPFTIVVLNMAEADYAMIPLIVLETLAANLGSMLLPMGNPQNLYLYSLTDMSLGAFISLMLPYSALSLVCILIMSRFMLQNSNITPPQARTYSRGRRDQVRLVIYILLFVISLMVVARIIDYRIGLIIVLLAVMIFDITILPSVDYSLICTFLALFIFIGNLKRIDVINEALSTVVSGHEVITSVLSSQCISNVPAAILLSGFTDNITSLIVGTNLGGLGTLIASMASLISFKQYSCLNKAKKGHYLCIFTICNLLMLALLLIENFILHIVFSQYGL